MRAGRFVVLWVVALAAGRPASLSADASARLTITLPDTLHVGDHVPLVLTLALPEDATALVMVTPTSQGHALDVVRGRLLRVDARDPQAPTLVFDLPVVAREPGTAILRVHAAFYRCREGTCEPVEIEATESVRVLPR